MTDPRKTIFDAIRAARGKVFDAMEVGAIDNLLDALGVPRGSTNDFERAIIAHLRFEEGVRPKAYKDHLGYWTIGIGRLIDPRKGGRITPEEDAILLANDPSRKGKEWREYVLTEEEMDMLKRNDIERFVSVIRDWPAWAALEGNVARQVALTSMAFQLGTTGLAGFKNSLRMLEQKRWAEAADNLLKSEWAKQTPSRARRITDMIRTGKLAREMVR